MEEALDDLNVRSVTYGDFFRNAPQMNEKRELIKGVVCGVRMDKVLRKN